MDVGDTIPVDWSDFNFTQDIDFSCPCCQEGYKNFEELDEDELKQIRETVIEDMVEDELGFLDDEEITDEVKFQIRRDIERNPELDEYVEEYYEENKENLDFMCDCCDQNGYLEPIYNAAYFVGGSCDEYKQRKAVEYGLFLFEHPDTGDTYMSLMGCGMDLSPEIIAAFRAINGWVPLSWAREFKADYSANLSKEEHMKNAISCEDTLIREAESIINKAKAVALFIRDPEYVRQKHEEQMKEFDRCIHVIAEKTKEIGEKDEFLGQVARLSLSLNCLDKANRDITE